MNILVTGAKGMVGTALVNNLKNIRDGKNRTRNIEINEIYEYDLDSTEAELDEYCAKADFVFNLAGVNRPENPEDFMKGNFGFASQLLDTLKKHNNKAGIMLSSSVQATLSGRFGNSEYGRSKKAGIFYWNGIKIGFVGASNEEKIRYTPQAGEDSSGILLAYDTTAYNQVISDAAKQCDYLIAYIHWGTEDTNDFNDVQQQMGREFLNSGADIVVGGHPHVLQGMEYVDGKPIVYSLGDFWFNGETKYTGLLKLQIDIDGLREMSFVPALQTGYTTQYLDAEEEQMELFGFLENLSPNVEIDQTGVIREK